MAQYYLDIETTGLDPKKDRIITIQYQELHRNTGKALGELKILKEWESSEADIVRTFISESKINEENPFSFVPVGYNLTFEHNFLKEKSRQHSLFEIDILNNPSLDLRTCGVLMNNGEFKGSGLDKLTGKPQDGSSIPGWYANKEYENIIDYIKTETKEFIRFNAWLYEKMPKVLEDFKDNHDI